MTDVLGFGVIFRRPTSARHAQKSLGKTTLRASRKRLFGMHVSTWHRWMDVVKQMVK